MITTTPQFFYIILILPSLFGLILLGEGVNKILHGDIFGIVYLILGLVILAAIIFYVFFYGHGV